MRSEARTLKEHMRDRYRSSGALLSPPHITLHMPFEWEDRKFGRLSDGLTHLAGSLDPIEIVISGFGCFPPRVLFLSVEKSPALTDLQHKVRDFCRLEFHLLNDRFRDQPFHPHLTIGFRDLRKTEFHQAWEEFKDSTFNARFTVSEFVLLKHNGRSWDELRSYPFRIH